MNKGQRLEALHGRASVASRFPVHTELRSGTETSCDGARRLARVSEVWVGANFCSGRRGQFSLLTLGKRPGSRGQDRSVRYKDFVVSSTRIPGWCRRTQG